MGPVRGCGRGHGGRRRGAGRPDVDILNPICCRSSLPTNPGVESMITYARSAAFVVVSSMLVIACVAESRSNKHATLLLRSEDLAHGDVAHLDTTAERLYSKPAYLLDRLPEPSVLPSNNLRQRALDTCEVTMSLSDMATDQWTRGAFARTESWLVRMLETCERTPGVWHPSVASSIASARSISASARSWRPCAA